MKASAKRVKKQLQIENPFEKVKVEDFNDDYSLIAYLFAKPEQAIYNKIMGRDNYVIVGGWGSGKTMLLKYLAFETQIEDIGADGVKDSDFIGIYLRPGSGSFKPFILPGGEFKPGGETLFGHFFNLLVLEKIISIILYGKEKGVFDFSNSKEEELCKRILSKFKLDKKINIGFLLFDLRRNIGDWRREIETFLATRDLESGLSYKDEFSIYPTNMKNFLDEIIREIKDTLIDLGKKRFYILLDECEQFSRGQQKVVNTIVKRRHTTMVFKMTTRPPDIQTWDTIDEDIKLTDRECKVINLDKEYDPTSKGYRQLCKDVAEKRLRKYNYLPASIAKILGKFTVENEVGRDKLEQYLKEKYPTKKMISDPKKFKRVYKDFKEASAFQILKTKKRYAGFESYVELSSGIMLHFLEFCRELFGLCTNKFFKKSGDMVKVNMLPLPFDIQNKAVNRCSQDFFNDYIRTRARSLKDPPPEMEFAEKIKYICNVLGGLFRDKLMTFNEPESARLEIPEGLQALDQDIYNPIRQIFEDSIRISVFQKGKPYFSKRIGGIKPPTWIMNRILAPYFSISPHPRWRTTIPAEVFNDVLRVNITEFKNRVLKRKQKKKPLKEKIKKEVFPKRIQLDLPYFKTQNYMPLITYLSKKIEKKYFEKKKFIFILHFLNDLIPFVEACEKIGLSPSNGIFFYKKYKYPNKEKVKKELKKRGYMLNPLDKLKTVLGSIANKMESEREPIIIVEDGGCVVPEINNNFPRLAKITIGAVEQTTNGIRNDEKLKNLLFPVISVPDSNVKQTFEPPHVARTVIDNIRKFMPVDFSANPALVIGYGSIGEAIALKLKDDLKMDVTVNDLENSKLLKAHTNGFKTADNLTYAVRRKSLIIGTTGETVIRRSEILAMENNTHLVSASSEQWEFGLKEIEALSSEKDDIKVNEVKIGTAYNIRKKNRKIYLLADGYPINFWGSESMPNEVSDLIISLLFVSAVEIASNNKLKKEIEREIVNELDKKFELSKMYLEYHDRG